MLVLKAFLKTQVWKGTANSIRDCVLSDTLATDSGQPQSLPSCHYRRLFKECRHRYGLAFQAESESRAPMSGACQEERRIGCLGAWTIFHWDLDGGLLAGGHLLGRGDAVVNPHTPQDVSALPPHPETDHLELCKEAMCMRR